MGMEYHEYTDEEKEQFRTEPGVLLKIRKDGEEAMDRIFPLFIKGSFAQTSTVEYMREQMTQKIGNRELAEKLIPEFAVGCRRLTVSILPTLYAVARL